MILRGKDGGARAARVGWSRWIAATLARSANDVALTLETQIQHLRANDRQVVVSGDYWLKSTNTINEAKAPHSGR